MKYIVLHKSSHRLRIRIPQCRMSLKEADIIEYYIRNIDNVRDVKIYDRTKDAVIIFNGSAEDMMKALTKALSSFSYDDEEICALVPEETGRALNRQYEDRLVMMTARHFLCKLFLPAPLKIARIIFKGIPFLLKGIKALMHEGLSVSVLDAVAIGVSIARKDYSTAGSIMQLLKTGELLEEWTRKKSINDLATSLSLNVDRVWLLTDEGEVSTDINKVSVGDEIIIRTSDIIPLDGVVVKGEATVNQASMTGESVPVLKKTDSYVYAGTVVDEGECIIRVTTVSGSGKYDKIVRMIEESEKLKSNTEAKAYHLADRLVPYSLAGSVLSYFFTRNVTKSLAFLMVDYSCAMKLSMPLSVLSAIKESGLNNISVKGGKFLEAMAEADTIVFDKTGTLTHAKPTLADIFVLGNKSPDEMLRLAACLEEHYPHSVATAIVHAAKEKGLVHDEMHSKVQYVVAHGVSSSVDGVKTVIGSYHFVVEDEKCSFPAGGEEIYHSIPSEYSRIFLGIDGKVEAVLCITDPLRDEAAKVISDLRELGIKNICMMTGDNKDTASEIAKKLQLTEYHAEVLPEDKASYIKEKRLAGHKVIMVGDGINDTPALSEADVGIAMSGGAAIAREISDITISSDDLSSLVTLRRISTALMDRIHSNYRFILGFNSLLILLGFAGIISPSASALLHNGSTILSGAKSMTPLLPEDKNAKN
ncbi:MAG: heavy metal translocating P-type ATPase [Lachnospiraceae bacterium]|nr:heavy metal translocating P-type ATPase [Lachnospiraceae bacterium]